MATNKEIAGEILKQLGGNKFIMMTGAYNFVTGGNDLGLKFKGSKAANYLKVTLTVMDVYTVEFAKIWGDKITWLPKHENVYNDMLQDIFTEVTGLYTRLF